MTIEADNRNRDSVSIMKAKEEIAEKIQKERRKGSEGKARRGIKCGAKTHNHARTRFINAALKMHVAEQNGSQ